MARTQVQTELIATNAISGTIIADNAITSVHIATNSISGVLVQDSGVTTTMIAANNITAAKIVSDGVETRHLHSNVVSGLSAVTAASGDYVLVGDTSDSNNLKKALVSDLGNTSEQVQDIAGAMFTGNTETGITATYQDGDGTVDLVLDAAQPTITSTGTLTSFRSTGIDDNADALAMTLDSSERLIIGHTASISGVQQFKLQVYSTTYDGSISLGRWTANSLGQYVNFIKSRHATIGSHTIVQDDDVLGSIVWNADDGASFGGRSAEIRAEVDGTPGTNDIPGRLVFATTADGAAGATTRMTIKNDGRVISRSLTGQAIVMAMIFG